MGGKWKKRENQKVGLLSEPYYLYQLLLKIPNKQLGR